MASPLSIQKNKRESPFKCISCDFEFDYRALVNVATTEEVLSSDTPALITLKKLGMTRICCYTLQYNYRVHRLISELKNNREKLRNFKSSDEHTKISIYPDMDI